MSSRELAQAVHDLRAPLARARTIAKLFLEAAPGELRAEEVPARMQELLRELEELDLLLKALAD